MLYVVGFFPKSKWPSFLLSGVTAPRSGYLSKTINRFGKIIEPRECAFGRISLDKLVNELHIPKGAVGQANEALHGCAGTCLKLPARDVYDPSSHPQDPAGF